MNAVGARACSDISVAALHALMQKPLETPVLLDVREPWEAEIATLAGSILIPMSEIPRRLSELPRTQPTVVFCHHGIRSMQVIAFLERHGFTNLHNLRGGIDAYSREVDAAVAVY